MATQIRGRTAKAHPTKAFFVNMLTRDITLADCILDLIDNSVDAAWSQSGASPTALGTGGELADFEIEIEFSKEGFTIRDNCGGISLDTAAEYAFTFGRDNLEVADGYTVGVYGIGMKRAVFKLGNVVEIRSTTDEESFAVPINVSQWLANPEPAWDFDIAESPLSLIHI